MRLVQLSDTYMLDLDRLVEVIFYPADGATEARVDVFPEGEDKTCLYDDDAITAWHRLRDLCEPQQGRRG